MLSPGTFLRPIIPTVFLSMPGGASSPKTSVATELASRTRPSGVRRIFFMNGL